MAVFCLLNDKCVINIPEPYPWWVCGSVIGLDSKLFHKQISNIRVTGGSYGCSMYLFKILGLEEKICILRQVLQHCSDIMYGYGCSVVQFYVLFPTCFDVVDKQN